MIGPEHSIADELHALAMAWALAATVPIPILVATDPARSGDIACLYLGLASGWLATEFYRFYGIPESTTAWRRRVLAIALSIAVNVALFVSFGTAAGVQTHFPFALMAVLSAIPAVGMTPLLMRRLGNPHVAIILGAVLVAAAKLTGCVVARFVYGPDYIEQGYVAGDWRTAKLMISVLWSLSTLLSLALLVADYGHCKGRTFNEETPGIVVT